MSDTLTAAIVAGGVSVLVSLGTAFTTFRLQEMRLRTELRTEFMAEEAIRSLLLHKDWELRSFDAIKRRVGGFADEQLRQLLVRAGALSFQGEGGKELWGLKERNEHRLS
jgi:hypothetical protein